MPDRTAVAVVGLGRMGIAICERLSARGFAVTGTDVRAEARASAPAVGARAAGSVPEAAAGARYVLTCLPGDAEVESVAAELAHAAAPGTVWIEMSTVSPGVATGRDQAAAAHRIRAIDAPVGGGPQAAREGGLLCFAGGPEEVVRAARPVLETLADRIVHTGPAGSGYLVKLLANALWFTQAVASAEAFAVAARAGLDPEAVRVALSQSAAAGRVLSDDARAFLRGENLPSFSLARCCDQLSAVLGMGERLAVELTVARAVTDVHRQALAHYGGVDGELLGARWVADRAGISFD